MSRICKIFKICRIKRSAGACPPRSLDLRENRSGPVARGPVPRNRPIYAKTEHQSVVRDRQIPNRRELALSHYRGDERTRAQGLARDRPSPYGDKGDGLMYRSAGACPPQSLDPRKNRTPAKAVSPPDRCTARDRPSPYGDRETALHRHASP